MRLTEYKDKEGKRHSFTLEPEPGLAGPEVLFWRPRGTRGVHVAGRMQTVQARQRAIDQARGEFKVSTQADSALPYFLMHDFCTLVVLLGGFAVRAWTQAPPVVEP